MTGLRIDADNDCQAALCLRTTAKASTTALAKGVADAAELSSLNESVGGHWVHAPVYTSLHTK